MSAAPSPCFQFEPPCTDVTLSEAKDLPNITMSDPSSAYGAPQDDSCGVWLIKGMNSLPGRKIPLGLPLLKGVWGDFGSLWELTGMG